MTTTSRLRPAHLSRPRGLRLVGAVTTAAAVAFVGVAALPPATALAAGVSDDHPQPVHHRHHPSALPAADTKVVATYRWVDGRWLPV